MRKRYFILLVVVSLLATASFIKMPEAHNEWEIPASPQRPGNAEKGYTYLTTGDLMKYGMPYQMWIFARGEAKENYLGRTGKNAKLEFGYNVVKANDTMDVVIPTCLQCHASVFEGKLVIGLGNSAADFSSLSRQNFRLMGIMAWRKTEPAKFSAVGPMVRSLLKVNDDMETEVRGVNPADRLAMLLAAHRDPKTLEWTDSAMLPVTPKVIPTDVPAWWLLKKKHAMFYTGFGRGDFSRFLMMSNLMTVRDTSEAREVSSHFGDVLAYINKLEPPKYPKSIDGAKAKAGEVVYIRECAQCHGTYVKPAQYPNLLVPGEIVGTDSALYLANQQSQPFIEWFNNSWFSEGDNKAHLVPGNGYVAPPLDGIWVTAPYLHNGSVPDLESLLNSKLRPQYWTRDFVFPQYDYDKVGWKYTKCDKADGKKVYNTTLTGYNNYGHTFGDKLSDQERAALIEYLKTL